MAVTQFEGNSLMYRNCVPLVLGSNSPRRKTYLRQLGLEFEVCPPKVDESVLPEETPADYVRRISREKAQAVMTQYPEHCVLSADTAVCLGSRIFGKPVDKDDAIEMLMSLSGKKHQVLGGYTVCFPAANLLETNCVVTDVNFIAFDIELATSYVEQGESLDKAGAYGIQGLGEVLVDRIAGSYSNVVGLPLSDLMATLINHSIVEVG